VSSKVSTADPTPPKCLSLVARLPRPLSAHAIAQPIIPVHEQWNPTGDGGLAMGVGVAHGRASREGEKR
jgi:hypothetical protein